MAYTAENPDGGGMRRPEQDDTSGDDPDPAVVDNEAEPEVPVTDFPSVPARDLGIDHTSDVDPPPNTDGGGDDAGTVG